MILESKPGRIWDSKTNNYLHTDPKTPKTHFLSKKLQKNEKNNNLKVLDEFTLKIVSADNLDQFFEL